MWFEIVHYPESAPPPPLLGLSHIAAELLEKIARIWNDHQPKTHYVFPQQKKRPMFGRTRKGEWLYHITMDVSVFNCMIDDIYLR